MTKKSLPTVDMGAAAKLATAEVEQANEYLTHINQMVITTAPELRFAVGVVAEIKEKHTAVDEQRRKFTDAAQAIIDEANTFFKPALKSLAECEAVIKEKVVEFDERQADKRNDFMLRAGDAGAGGSSGVARDLMKHADACIVPKVPGLSLRRAVKVEVFDPTTAIRWCIDNDRLELLQLNEKAIKALAKATNGQGLEVPGVTVKASSTVAITVADVERV